MLKGRFSNALIALTLTILISSCGGNGGDLVIAETSQDMEETSQLSNNPPLADAGPDIVIDTGGEITLSASRSSDSDGDTLSYYWSQTSGPLIDLGDGLDSDIVVAIPDNATDTRFSFQLSVWDGINARQVDNVDVFLRKLQADAGLDQVVYIEKPVFLHGSGTGVVDASSLQYSWTQISGPDVTLNDNTLPNPSFTAPTVETSSALIFRLSVSNGTYTGEPKTTQVTVVNRGAASQTAVAVAGEDIQSSDLTSISLDGSESTNTAVDNQLTYFWTQVSNEAPTVNIIDRTASEVDIEIPDVTKTEIFEFELTVRDAQNLWHSDTVTITVNNTYDPDDVLISELNCSNLDPDTVYIFGTIQEGSAGREVVANPEYPQSLCAGFPSVSAQTINNDGQLLYATYSTDRIYMSRRDYFIRNDSGGRRYPADPASNDRVIHENTASGCGIGSVFTNPETGYLFYTCPNSALHTPAASPYLDLGNSDVLTVLSDNSLLLANFDDLIIYGSDQSSTFLELPSSANNSTRFITAKHFSNDSLPSGGLWVAAQIDDAIHRFEINLSDFSIIDEGEFTALPDGTHSGYDSKIDGEGNLWQQARSSILTFDDAIIIRPISSSGTDSRIVYKESDDTSTNSYWNDWGSGPFVKMHGSHLVTGP